MGLNTFRSFRILLSLNWLNRAPLFLFQNSHCNVLTCIYNPNFETMPPDGTHISNFSHILTKKLLENIEILAKTGGECLMNYGCVFFMFKGFITI